MVFSTRVNGISAFGSSLRLDVQDSFEACRSRSPSADSGTVDQDDIPAVPRTPPPQHMTITVTNIDFDQSECPSTSFESMSSRGFHHLAVLDNQYDETGESSDEVSISELTIELELENSVLLVTIKICNFWLARNVSHKKFFFSFLSNE